MRIVIHSHWRGERWEGEVPVAEPAIDLTTADAQPVRDELLEFVFRYFNRVDEDDDERLAALGYRLPSLSVNDEVELAGARWRCASLGWEEVR